jgi:hypothetical protein
VRTLVDGARPAGPNEVAWDGRTDDGTVAAPGTYFVRLEAPEGRETRRVVRASR